MKAATISALCLALVLGACSSKSEDSSQTGDKDEPATQQRDESPDPPPPPPPDAKPAQPEPSTPEEIELARKAAFMDGRDADAIKYCEMGGTEAGKSDPQVLLGCALAACRAKNVDKARAWAKSLPKALGDQARKICHANGVTL